MWTNRHVATAGPLSFRATFFKEHYKAGAAEVSLKVVHPDSVHEFPLVRYDPFELAAKGIEPAQLSLAEKVRVFEEICVMRNDRGQIISLLHVALTETPLSLMEDIVTPVRVGDVFPSYDK